MLKRNSAILDTNVIVRFLVADDPENYKKSLQIFSDINDGKIKALLLDAVVAETVYVLLKMYKVSKEKIAEKLLAIARNKHIVINQKPNVISALEMYSKTNFDFIDCLVKSYAENNDLELVSFDKKLIR